MVNGGLDVSSSERGAVVNRNLRTAPPPATTGSSSCFKERENLAKTCVTAKNRENIGYSVVFHTVARQSRHWYNFPDCWGKGGGFENIMKILVYVLWKLRARVSLGNSIRKRERRTYFNRIKVLHYTILDLKCTTARDPHCTGALL